MLILVAIDGSTHSARALDLLPRLPWAQPPRLRLLHVIEKAVLAQPGITPSPVAQPKRETKRADAAAERLTRTALAKMRRLDPQAARRIERGPVSDKLLTAAEQEGADLLVMGSRGLSNVQAFLMGSVSQQVVTYAHCSTLVVKGRPRAVKRLLLAADGSPSSEQALSFLMTQFKPAGLQVAVVTVRDYPTVSTPTVSTPPSQQIEEQYAARLARAGFSAKAHAATGHAAARIIDTARRQRADLIVVGSRGLTGLQRFLLGSVSRQVVKYCPSSVLVVRGR
ncbi:MAG: universal stress protein [Nitrospirota bacterium]